MEIKRRVFWGKEIKQKRKSFSNFKKSEKRKEKKKHKASSKEEEEFTRVEALGDSWGT